jgi:hypothetical protein
MVAESGEWTGGHMSSINIATALDNARRRIGNSRQHLDSAWRELEGTCHELVSAVEILNANLQQEIERNKDLAARLKRMEDAHRDHGERLDALSKLRTTERLTSGEYIVHTDIAAEYRSFCDQALIDFATTFPQLAERKEALLLNWLSMALFEPNLVQGGSKTAYQWLRGRDRQTVPKNEFERVWQEASKIRQLAAGTGHPHKWDFECQKGGFIDPARQEAYGECSPDDPIEYVVTPGYVVVGKPPYVKQRVFTAPPPQYGAQSYQTKETRPGHRGDLSGSREQGGSPPGYRSGGATRRVIGGTGEGTGQDAEGEDPAHQSITDSSGSESSAESNRGEPGGETLAVRGSAMKTTRSTEPTAIAWPLSTPALGMLTWIRLQRRLCLRWPLGLPRRRAGRPGRDSVR